MADRTVLITGGAGFIGSHVADELLESGYRVRVLDCLDPQIHGGSGAAPDYLSPDVEFLRGDVRDPDAVRDALGGVTKVIHLAAAVGVGQSMYQIAHYTGVNDLGTAVLLEALQTASVDRLVVASSMSIYGEGLYRNDAGETVPARERTRDQFEAGDWECRDAGGRPLTPLPTPETKLPDATSVYALNKYVQERMCLIYGAAYRLPAVALRFFNVYGPRQALSNPYTGVLAIFSSRYLAGERPAIFEDGLQQRDFVNVHDVARACRLALERPGVGGEVFNVGSGNPVTIRAIAGEVADVLGCRHLEPEYLGKYRVGDIRRCFADITKARRLLGYEPAVSFADGLTELAEWLATQRGSVGNTGAQKAREELARRGLMV